MLCTILRNIVDHRLGIYPRRHRRVVPFGCGEHAHILGIPVHIAKMMVVPLPEAPYTVRSPKPERGP